MGELKEIRDQQESLANRAREINRKLWLAGLGAVSKAEEEGRKQLDKYRYAGEQALGGDVADRNVFFKKDWTKLWIAPLHGAVNAVQYFFLRHADALAQHLSGFFDGVRAVFANEKHVIRRTIVREDAVLAVVNPSTRRG